ncbi:TrgA family protein [Hasllibacter sp. MH4015]|uniref:TrgA family protein n=1 Tax=Hasllibacter sp. MH4015 TaxID=2854029 RepID=UPI001CD32D5A|nr:TrgA family protein [Hasllibacter sp. MH4015]
MPTGAKLVGGIVFMAVGWFAALQVILTMPEGTPATYFPHTIAAIGLWQGWMVMGNRAGAGIGSGIANGIRTSAQIAFFGLMLFALRTMFIRSSDLRYDSPGEATVDALNLFLEYFLQMLTVEIWGVLLIGGAVGGLVTELAAKAWR